MFRRNKLRNRQKQERQHQKEEHSNDRPICPQRRNEEHHREETPKNQVDAERERECARVSGISIFDAERRDQEHGEAEPEGAVAAVDRRAERVADAEFHDASYELGEAAHEDGEPEDGLVRSYCALRVGVW